MSKNILNETFQKHLGLMYKKLNILSEETELDLGLDNPKQPVKKFNSVTSNSVDDKTKQEFWSDFNEMSVVDFVNTYKSMFTDPKFHAFISAGIKDNLNDENFKVTPVSPKVTTLQPTQNEIGFGNSLNDLVTTTFDLGKQLNELNKILNGNNVSLGAKGGDVPVIIFAGKYIIDGHHRWSKVYCGNSDATIKCLNFDNPKLNNDPSKALKAFHLAIAKYLKNFPTEPKSGKNLLQSNKQAVYNHVYEFIISPNNKPFLDVYKKYSQKINNLQEADQQSFAFNNDAINSKSLRNTAIDPFGKNVAEYLSTNAQRLISGTKPATETPRSHMPQTDKAPGYEDALEKGEINFLPDKVT